MKTILLSALLLSLLIAISCRKAEPLQKNTVKSRQFPPYVTLDVPLIPQHSNAWCWAASGEMIMKRLGLDVPQCDQASHATPSGQSICCLENAPSACYDAGEPDFGFYGFQFVPADGPTGLLMDTMRAELTRGVPMGFYRHPKGGGLGHIVVIYGYDDQAEPCLLIRDPVGKSACITHAEYVGGGRYDYEHYRTYYGFTARFASSSRVMPLKLPVASEGTLLNLSERFDDVLRRARLNLDASIRAKADAKARFEELATQGMMQTSMKEELPTDIDKAQLLEALPSYSVRVDELVRYVATKPASELIQDFDNVVYLIRINDIPTSTVGLHRIDSTWKPSDYGTRLFAEQIDAALKVLPPSQPGALRFLVNVPGLGAVFLGRLDGDVIKLAPVLTNGMLEVGPHDVLPASEMFTRLHAAAEKFQ